MKRIVSWGLIGAFLVAFAVHPAVHAEDQSHACPLSTTGPDRAPAPVSVDEPLFVFAGRLPAALPTVPRSEALFLRDARGPPSPKP